MTIDILLSPNDSSASEINSLCLGSGRFLRSVLVPFLASHSNPAVFQTRGRGFVDFFLDKNTNPTADNDGADNDGADVTRTTSLQYPISTMHQNGLTSTSLISLSAAGTLGTPPGNSYLMNELISNSNSAGGIKCLEVIGVGVTEAGLLNASRKNGTMRDLTELLFRIYQRGLLINKVNDNNGDGDNEDGNANSDGGNTPAMMICPNPNGRICIINTDNVPKNGDVIRNLVLENAKEFYSNDDAENDYAENENENETNNKSSNNKETFLQFLQTRIAFLNTMVDRITSSQPNSNGLIPLCEPLPAKALVICDPEHDLPLWMTATTTVQQEYGVKIRHSQKELEMDMKLKLRVANGTHTAVAHVMALSSLVTTESLYDDDGDGNLSNATTNTNTDTTDTTANNPARLLLPYLDSLYQTQILPAATLDDIPPHETDATWHDWRRRLQHPHFGLSTFFITQNGAAKGGIRLGPSVKCLIVGSVGVGVGGGKEYPLSVSMAFAMASILRFLTPVTEIDKSMNGHATFQSKKQQSGIYVGWLDNNDTTTTTDNEHSTTSRDNIANSYSSMETSAASCTDNTVSYADGLRYNLSQGWYEFRCDCLVKCKSSSTSSRDTMACEMTLPEALVKLKGSRQPCAYEEVVRAYLLHPQGGDLQSLLEGGDDAMMMEESIDIFVCAVSTLYARMVSGDKLLDLLQEMMEKQHVYTDGLATSCSVLVDGVSLTKQDDLRPLHFRPSPLPDDSRLMAKHLKVQKEDIQSVVFSEVSSTQVIDLHTHLLPPSHGALCLWGIDELLTYHYLVAEYFMTAPANITPEGFYAMNKMCQANLIWDALFIRRTPISEATRGVITTLVALGLESHVKNRDLEAIRSFYESFRNDGLSGTERYCDLVYKVAGVRYAIMTNIPFDVTESQHWRPKKKEYPNSFKSALRVDPLLAGDEKTIEAALKASGYGTTLADARQYLHDWCDTMKPEYMMASTPHDFYLSPIEGGGILAGVKKSGVNESALQSPFAFTDVSGNDCVGCEDTDNVPSIINEHSDFLTEVLMPVCEERDLPLALKIGAHRGVNPGLLSAGDGMVAFADAGSLARLCGRFPKVRFLATFLSRANQHEACVLASKFRNLHLYGCWWYCNNPSIIHEITSMRVEMLGTAFTSQHSDARVMDQLIYKWSHSRAAIANVLVKEYKKTLNSGWEVTRGEIRRDIRRMLGGSYEEFMKKSLN